MNMLLRLGLAALCLLLAAQTPALAQAGKIITSDDILNQLDKKPGPEADPGKSRSFRGIRITSAADAKPHQPAEPARDMNQEKPAVTVYLYFKSGSSELAGEHSKKQLAALGKALSSPALAGAKLEIGGHTDSQGSNARNQTLSEQRAAHIRGLLVGSYGVNAANLAAKGYGETQPVAGNDTEAGRGKNRRVVIKRLD
ncbi:MAG: OmpA family protein [Proteobacteria bacterium]|nr:OmpA family protein [Pseudomonadota bacterium]